MGTTGRNRNEGITESVEQNQGIAQDLEHGGPVFEGGVTQQVSSNTETPVSPSGSFGGNASAYSAVQEASIPSSAIIRPDERSAVSTAVDSALGGSSSTFTTPTAAVPIVPIDTGLTPGVMSGRVSTQADSGYTSSAPTAQLASSELSDGSYVQDGTTQVRRDVQEVAETSDEHIVAKTQSQTANKQQYFESQSEELVREAGATSAPEPTNIFSRANRRFKESKKNIQDRKIII